MTIFLDFVKVCDIVNHTEFIRILPSFGLETSNLKSVTSYLNKRTQIVMVNGVLGEEKEIVGCSGYCPRSDFFYIIYINKICDLGINGEITTYVDDIYLIFSGPNWDLVYQKSKIELKRFVDLLSLRKLQLNILNTHLIAFFIYHSL